MNHRPRHLKRREGEQTKDAVEPAPPGHTHRPLGGDAEGGAGGTDYTFESANDDLRRLT